MQEWYYPTVKNISFHNLSKLEHDNFDRPNYLFSYIIKIYFQFHKSHSKQTDLQIRVKAQNISVFLVYSNIIAKYNHKHNERDKNIVHIYSNVVQVPYEFLGGYTFLPMTTKTANTKLVDITSCH